jgi:DNA-binding NarL/FixJ family response regulator
MYFATTQVKKITMEIATSIRVLLVSRHPIILIGLERLISSQRPKLEVVKGLTQCSDAISQSKELLPDVILLDLDADIDEAINAIPLLSTTSQAKVLVLTGLCDDKVSDEAMLRGARGVLQKEEPPDTVVRAIKGVHAGQFWLDRAGTSRLVLELSRQKSAEKNGSGQKKIKTLTTREIEIASCVTQNSDATSKSIAKMLCISNSTLRNHLGSIYEKLGIRNRVGLWNYMSQNKPKQ